MAEILHQLRLVVYLIIYKVLYTSPVVLWDFWTINSNTLIWPFPQGQAERPFSSCGKVEHLWIPCEQGIAQTVVDGRFNLQPGSDIHRFHWLATEMTDVSSFKKHV